MPQRVSASLLRMNPSILIAYATKNGSTEQVANEVAARLSAHGLVTDVRAARDIRALDGHVGVVLGSAIYMGTRTPAGSCTATELHSPRFPLPSLRWGRARSPRKTWRTRDGSST